MLIVVVAAAVATVTPAGAAASKPACGKAVLKDWSDGKLDRTYPVRCYQDALNRMPEDMLSYTTAPDDIERALLARLRAGRTHHARPAQTARAQSTPGPARKPAAAQTGRSDRRPEREALSAAGADSIRANGIPRPLVALAGIGALLIVTGSMGLAARKLRGRAVRS